jgi:hypothetical protein
MWSAHYKDQVKEGGIHLDWFFAERSVNIRHEEVIHLDLAGPVIWMGVWLRRVVGADGRATAVTDYSMQPADWVPDLYYMCIRVRHASYPPRKLDGVMGGG